MLLNLIVVPRQKKQKQDHDAADPVVHRAHTIQVDVGCFFGRFYYLWLCVKDSSGNIYF